MIGYGNVLFFGGSCFLNALLIKIRSYKAEILVHPDSEASVLTSCLIKEIQAYTYSYGLSLLDPSGLIHSMLYGITRKLRFGEEFLYEREILALEDGGTVALDWRIGEDRLSVDVPVVIIQHGLCGHSQSSYVKSMIAQLEGQGFYVVVFVARGCGRVPLTTPETFNASRTSDFKSVVQHVTSQCPGRDIHSVGFSLGAGLLLKYLGEHGKNSGLRSAVAISPSFDFHIKTGLFGRFSSIAVKGLIKYAKEHREFLEDHPSSLLDWDGMMNSRSILEFDEAAIVGKHRSDGSGRFLHHPSVDDYYKKSSCIHVAHLITTPTLVLCAQDDPVCSIEGAPKCLTQMGRGLAVVKVKHGGHVGFGDHPLSLTFFCDRIAGLWMMAAGGGKKILRVR